MSRPRTTDTGCPHPGAQVVTLIRPHRATPENLDTHGSLVGWCGMCGSLFEGGEWTAPRSVVLPGWHCAKCGVFNGAAKELRTNCRSCGAPFTLETKT